MQQSGYDNLNLRFFLWTKLKSVGTFIVTVDIIVLGHLK